MAGLICYSYGMFVKRLLDEGWSDGNLPDEWVFISIGNHIPDKNESHPLNDCESVLNLDFDDISGYRLWESITDYKWTEVEKEMNKDVYGMSVEQAGVLFEFLDRSIGKNVMVHCSAGLSRSQGVVRFLLDMYPEVYSEKDTNPDNPCRIPNLYVTSLLKREFWNKYGFLTE